MMRFDRISKIDAITGKETIEYVEATGDKNFAIVVDHEGCRIRGESPLFHGHGDLGTFAKTVGLAVVDSWKFQEEAEKSQVSPEGFKPFKPE